MKSIKIKLVDVPLIVKVGDLKSIESELVISPIDSYLFKGGFKNQPISFLYGESVNDEFKEAKAMFTRALFPGQCFPSNSGYLNCDKMLHTVVPQWSQELEQKVFMKDLDKSYSSPIIEACDRDFEDLVLVSTSFKHYNYPPKYSSYAIFNGIFRTILECRDYLAKVTLLVYDEEDFNEFLFTIEKIMKRKEKKS